LFSTHFIRSAEGMQAQASISITFKSPPTHHFKEEEDNLKRRPHPYFHHQ